MFCVKHPRTPAERLCARCRLAVCSGCLRWVGSQACCGEACAVMYLMERASAAAFALAVQESRRSAHGWLSRLRLLPLRRAAARTQREFEAYLDGLKVGRGASPPQPWWAEAWARARAVSLPRPAWHWARWAKVAAPATAIVVLAWAAATAFVPRQRAVPPVPPPTAQIAPEERPASEEAQEPEPEVSESPAAVNPEAAKPAPPPILQARPIPRRETAARPSRSARSSLHAADVTRGNLEVQEVALTFDAHSEGDGAEEILEALRARGVHATMFLTGGYIRKYPDLVRRIVADGHEVGNHMNTHPRLTTYARDGRQATLAHVTREFVQRQLREADEAFREVTGRAMAPLWRAPYGEHNGEIRAWAAEAGYRHVGWTRDPAAREDLDSRDWVADPHSKIYRSAREIRDRILRFGRSTGHGLNGGIVLMHLGTQRRRDQAHSRLAEILDGLTARAYRLVTISEMIGDAPPAPDLARLGPR